MNWYHLSVTLPPENKIINIGNKTLEYTYSSSENNLRNFLVAKTTSCRRTKGQFTQLPHNKSLGVVHAQNLVSFLQLLSFYNFEN